MSDGGVAVVVGSVCVTPIRVRTSKKSKIICGCSWE